MWTAITAIFSIISGLLGIPQWLRDRANVKQGKIDQQLSDANALQAQEDKAHEVTQSTGALSDDAIADKLRDYTIK